MAPLNVVFMGTPAFTLPTLQYLIAEHHLALVVTQPDKPQGRGKKLIPCETKQFILNHRPDIPILQPETLKDPDCYETMVKANPDLIVVAAYGRILGSKYLALPKFGCLNIHGSILPEYRGAAPINWAITRGETRTGITIMLMDKGLDTGDILLTKECPISPDDTTETLSQKLATLGATALKKCVEEQILNGQLQRTPQDHAQATYAPMLKKEDGLINWSMSAQELDYFVRGMHPWPCAYTFHKGTRFLLHRVRGSQACGENCYQKGEVIAVSRGFLLVQTGAGLIEIERIQREGKQVMDIGPFLAGYRIEKGDRFESVRSFG